MLHGDSYDWPCSTSALHRLLGKPAPHPPSEDHTLTVLCSATDLVDLVEDTLERGGEASAAVQVLHLHPAAPSGQTEGDAIAAINAAATPHIIVHPSPMDKMDSMALELAGSCTTVAEGQLCTGWKNRVTGVWSEAIEAAGLEGNTALGRAVLLVYQRSTLMSGGHLDLEATYAEYALRHSDSSSSFHTRSWLTHFALLLHLSLHFP